MDAQDRIDRLFPIEGVAALAAALVDSAPDKREERMMDMSTLFPVNQLPARERRAYVALNEAQRTAYRVARLDNSSHGEAMRAAKAVS